MFKNLDQKFPEKKDKKEAAEYLRILSESKGWQILTDLMEEELQKIDEEMKTTKFNKENIEKLSELQLKFAHLTILKKLPEELMLVLLDEKSIEELTFDIY